VSAVHPFYVIRLAGGLCFLTGALIMVYNLVRTARRPLIAPVSGMIPVPVGE
jgi:cytochrome c oxidase cbb3-type subunit 1